MNSFFITIPHSSERIPKEVQQKLQISAKRLREIAEPGIEKIFDWPKVKNIKGKFHQSFPNLNRKRNNVDPATNTPYNTKRALFPAFDFHGDRIYKAGQDLTPEEKNALLIKYYDSFFKEIDRTINKNTYDFFIDAHAMNNATSSYENLRKRPDICLGNRGNTEGENRSGRSPITFPSKKIQALRNILINMGYDCRLNSPFSGGYIIQRYAKRFLPCFQIEINKRLFMTTDDGEIIPKKIKGLKKDLMDAILTLVAIF